MVFAVRHPVGHEGWVLEGRDVLVSEVRRTKLWIGSIATSVVGRAASLRPAAGPSALAVAIA